MLCNLSELVTPAFDHMDDWTQRFCLGDSQVESLKARMRVDTRKISPACRLPGRSEVVVFRNLSIDK